MSFTSPVFFIFLPIVLLLYRILPKKYRPVLLLAASYIFYAYYDVRLLTLIFITTIVSYICARCMNTESAKARKRALIIAIITCLGILFAFKYFNFAVDGVFSILRLFGVNISFDGFDILLPMGISFYVFQTMSYTFDVYRGKYNAESNLGYYALFVVFFPQLVAGPIERPADLLPQLKNAPTPSRQDFAEGFKMFLRGYAKKFLIADFVAVFVNTAYSNPKEAGGAALIVATIMFAFQIYCDFSGYSDIALGCARFMGIRLSENFHSPYSASSIGEFWKRWHISLTRWFTDYLYIPLGGSRKGLPCQCRNIMIVFLVSGLWHGANLTYVVWGGLHGFYLIIEKLISKRKLEHKHNKFFGIIITFTLVCFAWIFFRASSINDALYIIRTIFTNFNGGHLLLGLGITTVELLAALLLICALPLIEKLPTLCRPLQARTLLFYYILTIAIIICRSYILTGYGSSAFIYFQF